MFHNEFQLPSLTLADPTGVIDLAVSDVRMNSVHHTTDLGDSAKAAFIRPYALERAHKVFNSLTERGKPGLLSIYRLNDVLHELGLDLNASDVTEVITQLELKDTMDVSFAEAVEIATYIHEQKLEAQRGAFN
jgi:Ca2+-binding EF-hand superfamily protein